MKTCRARQFLTPWVKTLSPHLTFRSGRDKWGMGVRHSLFPAPTLGAPLRGCRFPDAILHGKRSFRPRSRAVQCLAAAGFRVRLFSSLRLVVATPACEPGQDTPAISSFASWPLASGLPPFFDGAFARGHGSRLFTLKLLFIHSPAVSFLTSPALGSFSRGLPGLRGLPGVDAHFVTPFGGFLLADQTFFERPPESSIRADTQ